MTISPPPHQYSFMCGRYSITTPVEALRQLFRFEGPLPNLAASYNVAPTHAVPIVNLVDHTRRLSFVRWGLVPSWAKKIGDKPLINARSETIAEKPSFRAAFRRRRCLFPADGFFEWQAQTSGPKQPYNIVRSEGGPFAMAGIWDDWMGADGTELASAAIVTTAANRTLKNIHARMPVILDPRDFDQWLSPSTDLDDVAALMRAAPDNYMRAYPVSRRVNAVANNDADLLVEVEAGGGGGGEGQQRLL